MNITEATPGTHTGTDLCKKMPGSCMNRRDGVGGWAHADGIRCSDIKDEAKPRH